MSEPTTPELIAARWRKDVAARLIKLAGMIATGQGMVGGHEGLEVEIDDAYGVLVAFVAPQGIIVDAHGIRTREDVQRLRFALTEAFDPDAARSVHAWEAEQQAKVDAYAARSFPCEMGGHCKDRFETDRGRATHYAAARRRVRDWAHDGASSELPAPTRPQLTLASTSGTREP